MVAVKDGCTTLGIQPSGGHLCGAVAKCLPHHDCSDDGRQMRIGCPSRGHRSLILRAGQLLTPATARLLIICVFDHEPFLRSENRQRFTRDMKANNLGNFDN